MSRAEPEREAGADGEDQVVDVAAGLVLAAAAVVALAYLIPRHTEPALGVYDVAPGFFPTLAASAVLVLAIGLVAIRIARWQAAHRGGAGRDLLAEMAIWAAVAGTIMIGLQTAGFLPTAALAIAAIMTMVGLRSWRLVVPVALLFPLAVDLAAWHIFTVDLP